MGRIQKTEDFDSALQFRLAMAYLRMERYREAALIMENMVAALPPNALHEQASLNGIRCWNALGNQPKSIASAQAFATQFPNSQFLPQVLFMQGEAYRTALEFEKAVEVFAELAEKFPKDDFTSRARFLKAFALLQAEKTRKAPLHLAIS